jgi:hypothetical protein
MAEQHSVDMSWKLLMEDRFEDLRIGIGATSSEMSRSRHRVVNDVMATDIMDKDLIGPNGTLRPLLLLLLPSQ